LLGICSPTMSEPFQALDLAERHRVRQVLDELASHEPEICGLKAP
jgi:hypothetical protein